MTYFYKVFKRYTHFSLESVSQLMDGQNQLFFDQPIKVRSKIQRVADLVSDVYFTFQLPDIYSKYVAPPIPYVPTSLTLNLSLTTLSVTWPAAQWATSYTVVFYSNTTNPLTGTSTTLGTVTTTGLSASVNGYFTLYNPPIYYYFTIVATGFSGTSGPYRSDPVASLSSQAAVTTVTYTPPPPPPTTQRIEQYEFKWVEYVGPALISSVAIFIGGQKIQEFDGSYLVASALVDYPTDTMSKWKVLVGQVPELTDPAHGMYPGGGVPGTYPHVVRNTSLPIDAQLNRPSIFGRMIRVPMPFWFTQEGSALPLVGLQFHEVEIQITLNPINTLYTVLDASGFRVAPGVQTIASQNAIDSNLPDYGTVYDANANLNAFLVDVGVPTPGLSTWNLNPTLEVTYVYLPESERTLFASSPMSYLVHQVTHYPFPTLYTRQVLDLETHNPIERLLFVNRRSDSVQFRNQSANFTNWISPTVAPFLQGTSAVANLSSGQLLQYAQRDIIRTLRVMCDGNELQQEKPIEFMNAVYPFRTTNGNPNQQIPIYSFALHSLSPQPSGSINASRIRVFQVEVNPYQLPPNTTYVYDLSIYVESINFVEITGGMGGLKYAL